jgi:hypothetical protein
MTGVYLADRSGARNLKPPSGSSSTKTSSRSCRTILFTKPMLTLFQFTQRVACVKVILVKLNCSLVSLDRQIFFAGPLIRFS